MDNGVITAADQLSTEWLTEVLVRNGSLKTGAVGSFQAEEHKSNWSQIVRIKLQYSEPATGDKPDKLLLKICSGGNSFGPSEVNYYRRDYLGLPDKPLIRHYDTAYSPDPPQYHILMDDLSDTFENNKFKDPTLEYAEAVARGLAALHGYRWGPARLAEIGETLPGLADVEKYMAHIRPGLAPLLKEIEGLVEPGWLPLISEVFEQHPAKMIQRLKQPEGFTLIPGVNYLPADFFPLLFHPETFIYYDINSGPQAFKGYFGGKSRHSSIIICKSSAGRRITKYFYHPFIFGKPHGPGFFFKLPGESSLAGAYKSDNYVGGWFHLYNHSCNFSISASSGRPGLPAHWGNAKSGV